MTTIEKRWANAMAEFAWKCGANMVALHDR
jgi:hypothetical protein